MRTPQIITGPLTSKVSKKQAEAQLVRHPSFPKGASYTLDEVEGRWIASFIVEAAPPDAFADGGGPGETPAGPPEPSEVPKGPDETPDEGPELPDEGDDKPKGDKKDKGESEKGELGEIKELLTLLVTALGLGGDANPVPGADDMGPPPPPPGPPTDAPGGDNKTHTVHERALKPGEAPPGTTPIGSPTFAHVRDDHPWKIALGVKKTFSVDEPIGEDESMASIASELKALAAETGVFRVAQLNEDRVNGQRIARALISQ